MGLLGDVKRPGSGVHLAGGLLFTALVHGAIIAGVWIGHARAGERVVAPPIGQFVEVQAVKFGKPRDLSFLPHKEAPKVDVKPKLQLTTNDKALPRLDDKKDEKKDPTELPREHSDDLARMAAAENATGSQEDVGDPNGIKGGTATEAKGDPYLQKLVADVTNAWVLPTTLSDAALARLEAQACIKIDATGNVIPMGISKSSGNQRYDNTLLDAIAQLKEFPAPPSHLKVVSTDGVCMNFKKQRTAD